MRRWKFLGKLRWRLSFALLCILHLVAEAEIDAIGELLQGTSLWVLQQYVPLHAMVEEWQELEVYRPEQLYILADRAGGYIDQVQIRGI